MIGIFDSGVGGLTVVRALRQLLPDVPLLYFGDTARTPYGNKGSDTIRRFAVEDARLLVDRGATMLVIACNTMSAVALDALQERFPNLPLFDVITPAVAATVAEKPKRVGVIGTRATIGSGVYQQRIASAVPGVRVVAQACPLLVPLVEENMAGASETTRIVRRYLTPLVQVQVEALILGCTHYPFLKKTIAQKMGKRTKIVDSAEVTAQTVAAYVHEHPEVVNGSPGVTLLFSDLAPHTEALANEWAGSGVRLEGIPLDRIEGKM